MKYQTQIHGDGCRQLLKYWKMSQRKHQKGKSIFSNGIGYTKHLNECHVSDMSSAAIDVSVEDIGFEGCRLRVSVQTLRCGCGWEHRYGSQSMLTFWLIGADDWLIVKNASAWAREQ